jgi:hypothetical protein
MKDAVKIILSVHKKILLTSINQSHEKNGIICSVAIIILVKKKELILHSKRNKNE